MEAEGGGPGACTMGNRLTVKRTRRGEVHLKRGDGEDGAGGGSTRGMKGTGSRGEGALLCPVKDTNE